MPCVTSTGVTKATLQVEFGDELTLGSIDRGSRLLGGQVIYNFFINRLDLVTQS